MTWLKDIRSASSRMPLRACRTCGGPLPAGNTTWCSRQCMKSKSTKPCAYCGRDMGLVPARAAKRKYCGFACMAQARRGVSVVDRAICRHCGKNFSRSAQGIRRDQKYCSRQCSVGSRRPPAREGTCEACGVLFSYRGARERRFCSRGCARTMGWMKKADRVQKICPGCGKQFSLPASWAGRQEYCSRDCKKECHAHPCLYCGRPIGTARQKHCNRLCQLASSRIMLVCHQCAKPFGVSRAQLKHRSCSFCSNKCRTAWMKGRERGAKAGPIIVAYRIGGVGEYDHTR